MQLCPMARETPQSIGRRWPAGLQESVNGTIVCEQVLKHSDASTPAGGTKLRS